MRIPPLSAILALYVARDWVLSGWLQFLLVRKMPGTVDSFDDMLIAHTATELVLACRCTTDPGRPSREHPKRADGTAVWAAGQVIDGLTVGRHHDSYACLVPAVPIPVLRYTSLTDDTGEPSTSSSTQIHRASADHESSVVGAWSEGCIVVANPDDFDRLIGLVNLASGKGQRRFSVSLTEGEV